MTESASTHQHFSVEFDWTRAQGVADLCREIRLATGFPRPRVAAECGVSLRSVERAERTGAGPGYLEALAALVPKHVKSARRRVEFLMGLEWAKEQRRRRGLGGLSEDARLKRASLIECWLCRGEGTIKKAGGDQPCHRCGAVGFMERTAPARRSAITVPGQSVRRSR